VLALHYFLCNYCLFLKHFLTNAFRQTDSIGLCKAAGALIRLPLAPTIIENVSSVTYPHAHHRFR
jgi:hypothetical protein